MGGDKPLRRLAGKPLVHWMADWAKAQSERVALAVRAPEQVHGLGLPSLIDGQCGIGPISALVSAFDYAATTGCERVLLVGCDQPFLPANLLERLSAMIGDAGAAMPVCGKQAQPMATLWRTDPAVLKEYLAGGGQSLWRFAREVGARRVDWDACAGADPFFNINDADALAEAEIRVSNAGG